MVALRVPQSTVHIACGPEDVEGASQSTVLLSILLPFLLLPFLLLSPFPSFLSLLSTSFALTLKPIP